MHAVVIKTVLPSRHRSPNPALHWTNVTVRYCWSDYQQILWAIAADPSITVTDPLTVDKAWGRPFG